MTGSALFPVAVLAGGLATRLHPVTQDIPKSLIEVAGEPFVFHQCRQLYRQGIRDVVFCAGFLGEQIQERLGDGSQFGLSIQYSFDGEVLRGTGGAIRNALPLLGPAFFVIYGDSYLFCDLRGIQESWEKSGQAALMTVYRNAGRWDTSNVEFDGQSIIRYDKRNKTPKMHYIDYGLGVFSADVFSEYESQPVQDLADIYQALLAAGELAGYEVTERFYEIGSFDGIRALDGFLRST